MSDDFDDLPLLDELVLSHIGTYGDDRLNGSRGDDVMSGGAGDDQFYGWRGFDTVAYEGSIEDYEILKNADGTLTVRSLNSDEGTDLLHTIEAIQFADATYDAVRGEIVADDRVSDGTSYVRHDGVGFVTGGAEDDVLVGGYRDDVINGWRGDDTVVYERNIDDYEITTNANGTLTVRALKSDEGTDTLGSIETIRFANAMFDVASGVVTPTNQAPVTVADIFQASEDTTLFQNGVLDNDTDPDGDALIVADFDKSTAAGGSVSMNAEGHFYYTPPADFSGEDTFTYTAVDGHGQSRTETVTMVVAPVNDAPDARADAAATDEDTAVLLDLLANDSDRDGDALSIVDVGDAEHGSVTIGTDGSVLYTPETDFSGTDSFSYEVSDGNGGVVDATATVTVAAVADAPILDVPASLSGIAGEPIALDLAAFLQDQDGSEELTVFIEQLPQGATLSAGTMNDAGAWMLSSADLDGLQLTLPKGNDGAFNLRVTAQATESANGDMAAVAKDITLSISPADNNTDNSTEWSGRELWVGEGAQYSSLSDAVGASHEGDTIYIRSGVYTNAEAVIPHSLRIIGVGDEPAHLHWEGPNKWGGFGISNNKGILVTKPDVGHLYVENIAFSGAEVGDRNGAGIRHQGGELTVVNSVFSNNQNGILATGATIGDVHIEGSVFDGNGFGDGFSHGIYIKDAESLTVENSQFLNTKVGHHIKSMAHNTVVRDSVIDDAGGTASYSVESSKGGNLLVENNTIIQSSASDNPDIISYSVARGGESGEVIVRGNTIINQHPSGVLVDNDTDSVVQILDNTINNEAGGWLAISSGLAVWQGNLFDGVTLPDRNYDSGAVYAVESGDTMIGGLDDDIFAGQDGNETLAGGGGKDVLFGNNGSDILLGGQQRDHLYGGDDDDWLFGGSDPDLLTGDAGNDILAGGSGDDILIGGSGNDVLVGGAGIDVLNGGKGEDVAVFAGSFDQYRVTEEGGRHFVKANSAWSDAPDLGHDKISDVEKLQFLDGIFDTATNTFTQGATPADYGSLLALEPQVGNEQTVFNNNPDTASVSDEATSSSWPTNPTIIGTSADDELIGTDGDDVLYGAGGKDVLAGGLGNDTYLVDRYNVKTNETSDGGIDTVYSSAKAYGLLAEIENLVLVGEDDTFGMGNKLDNTILGNNGSNILQGGAGNDRIIGGLGNDELSGNRDSDVFVFDTGDTGQDTITDWDTDSDFIEVHGGINELSVSSNEELLARISSDGNGNSLLDLGGGNSVLILGTNPDDFSLSNLLLV